MNRINTKDPLRNLSKKQYGSWFSGEPRMIIRKDTYRILHNVTKILTLNIYI